MMLRRDRVIAALEHREPDIVPWNISFTISAAEKMREHFAGEFPDCVGNHLAVIEPRTPDAWTRLDEDTWRDEFGVEWDRSVDKDIGVPRNRMVPERSLDGIRFPEIENGRFDGLARFCEENSDRFRVGAIGFSLFERAWTMRGMAELFVDMMEAPGFVDEFLDAICDWNVAVVREMCDYEIDAVHFGDDWGSQRGLLMGPELWRRFIRPRLERMYGEARKHGKRVFCHSCGDVREVLGDLIEMGLSCFNPFQPEVMQPEETKDRYGDRLSFWGGISTQKTLPYGSPDDVKREARSRMETIGRGGGYILAPAHDTPKDVPLENMLALLQAVKEQED